MGLFTYYVHNAEGREWKGVEDLLRFLLTFLLSEQILFREGGRGLNMAFMRSVTCERPLLNP